MLRRLFILNLLIFFLYVLHSPSHGAEEASIPLSLDESITRALERSTSIRAAEHGIKGADYE